MIIVIIRGCIRIIHGSSETIIAYFCLPDLNNYFSETDRLRAKCIPCQAGKPGFLPVHSTSTESVLYSGFFLHNEA